MEIFRPKIIDMYCLFTIGANGGAMRLVLLAETIN